MSTQSSSTVASRLAVVASVAALSLSARADNYKWDNAGGDNRMANGDNWYLDGSDPKEYGLPTAENDAEVNVDNSHLMLSTGESFSSAKFTFTNGSATQYPVVDISGGTFTVGGDLNLGYWGRRGEFNVSGGDVTVKNLIVGDYGSRYYNKFNVSGGNVTIQDVMKIGTNPDARGNVTISGGTVDVQTVHVGNGNLSAVGGAGQFTSTLTITGGSMTAATMEVGNSTSAGGLVQVSGADALTVSGDLKIGCSDGAWAQVDVLAGGNITTTGNVNIGNHASAQHAVLNVAGGEVDAATIYVGKSGSGTLKITDDGIVRAKQIQREQNLPAGSYRVFMDGGTIVAKQNVDSWYLASIDSVTLGENGGAIDTNGHNLKIMACYGFDGIGSFTKKGDGTLTISYSDYGIDFNYKAHGKIIVEGGTLKLPSHQTIYCEGVEVAEGATLDRSGSEIIIVDREIAYARWTNAAGDGDASNPLNWSVILRYSNQDVSFEEAVSGMVPSSDTPIIVPYAPGAPSFDAFTDVTWVVEDDVCSEGYSRPDVLKTAAVWYDPSDTSTLTLTDGKVTAMANKGIAGADLDLERRTTSKDGAALSTDGFNGRQSIFYNGGSGYRSKNSLPGELTADGERTLFTVAKGDNGKMVMLSVAQNASSDEEGRHFLLAHGTDWGRAYKVGISNNSGGWVGKTVDFVEANSNTAYVFGGRTAKLPEGDADERSVISSVLSATGSARLSSTNIVSMSKGKEGLDYRVYYGTFEIGMSWVDCDSDGYQGEALIFTNALNDADMDAVNAYLKAKWLDAMQTMPNFDSLVVNAQVDLGGATRTFEKLSGSGSFVDGTVVLTGDLVVTVNPDQSVVVPTFDKLVLGPSARLVVNGARNLPTSGTINIIPFTSLEGEFSSAVGDRNTRVILRYSEDHVSARRDAGLAVMLR